jgi:hypothetical protein
VEADPAVEAGKAVNTRNHSSEQVRKSCGMNFLVELGDDGWRAIAVLSAAVALSACTATTLRPPSHTDTSPSATAPIEIRPLSLSEKAALAKALSQTVPNPRAAQFKWLPVAAGGKGPIGYCGLINVQNSYGEHVGFHHLFAMIEKGPKGDYVNGRIEHIGGSQGALNGDSSEGIAQEPGLTEENCKEWGYTDFSVAM